MKNKDNFFENKCKKCKDAMEYFQSVNENWEFMEERVIKAEMAWEQFMNKKLDNQKQYILNEIKKKIPTKEKKDLIKKIRGLKQKVRDQYNHPDYDAKIWNNALNEAIAIIEDFNKD